MEDDDETFDDYVDTTVPIGQVLPLLVVGIISFLLFVPVISISLRPSQEIDDDDGDENVLENGEAGSSSIKNGAAEKSEDDESELNETESLPLLSNASAASSGYGGLSSELKPDNNTVASSIPENGLNSSELNDEESESDSDDEIEDDGAALKFCDPASSALEKLKIVTLNNCDPQSRAMIGMGFPYLIQAIISAASEMIQMAVVGHQLGTNALSAYVVIDLFIKLTSDAVGYVIISGNTMISQIAEAEDKNRSHKIGSYLQLSILFYVIGMIPIIAFWWCFTDDVLLFLNLDPDMAEEGQRFVFAYTLAILVDGIASSIQYTLDVVGFQVQSTVLTFVGEAFTTSCIVFVMCFHTLFPDTSLTTMGWTYLFVDLCYLGGMLSVINLKGWLKEYYVGFFSSPLSIFQIRTPGAGSSSNENGASRAAVKLMLSNACQYALSNFLFQGEWQILVFFASSLGSAEVAAWGVLGIIWEELEYIVMAISDGCEVRVALTLGKGDIKNARLITYKAIWLCFVWGVFVSIVFTLFEDQIPRLITNDPVLQDMVSFNLPMISLANIVSGIAIMAEHVLWCQNRAPLATAIASGTSGFITIPLAGLSSYVFHLNLIGQTAGVAIGAAAFAALSMYAVVSSDWEQISENVIAMHEDSDEESDDESEDESESESEDENDAESDEES